MVFSRPPTCKTLSPFNNPLVTAPKAPITIGIIVTFMFHSFFNSLARSRYLSFFSYSFSFIQWSAGTAKSTILQILLYNYFLVYLKEWRFLLSLIHCFCQVWKQINSKMRLNMCLLPVLFFFFHLFEIWIIFKLRIRFEIDIQTSLENETLFSIRYPIYWSCN